MPANRETEIEATVAHCGYTNLLLSFVASLIRLSLMFLGFLLHRLDSFRMKPLLVVFNIGQALPATRSPVFKI